MLTVLLSLGGIFDVDRKERRLEEVNREVENPALWDDPKRAQEISKEQKLLEDLVGSFKRLSAGITDAKELFNMAIADEDFDGAELVAEEVETFRHDVEKLEFKRMFNKPQDSANCYIEIQAGAGGTEAQDWASMLERMYLRYAERANARRHTSFASVYIYPEIDDSIEITINPADLRVDVFRASGAGGQHVQKTESAVRITHIPTGVVTVCQDDRSQHNNREQAMRQLKAKLYELELRKRMAEQEKLEESKSDIGWGHQIRSYVLDQSRVKDLRTNVETGNTGAVLDGDLDQFIEASLKMGI